MKKLQITAQLELVPSMWVEGREGRRSIARVRFHTYYKGNFRIELIHTTTTAMTLLTGRIHRLAFDAFKSVRMMNYSQDMRTDKYPGVEEASFCSGLSAIQVWREKMRDDLVMEY